MTNEMILNEEIKDQMARLSHLEVGSDEYTKAVEGITKLYDRSITMYQIQNEAEFKEESRDMEHNLKQQELELDKHDRKIKNFLTGLGIGIPAGISVWATLSTFNFEKFGTISTLAGKTHLNKVLNLFKR